MGCSLVSAPISSGMVTLVQVVHGDSLVCSRYSTGTPSTFALAAAYLVTLRHPMVVRRRRGAVLSAIARSGPSGCWDAAVLASLAASTSRRVRTGTSPASAIGGSLLVLTGQPVTTRAAARFSLSRSSTYVSDAAGSHAAAAHSSAPRTYPLATVRSCGSRRPQERAVSLRC